MCHIECIGTIFLLNVLMKKDLHVNLVFVKKENWFNVVE